MATRPAESAAVAAGRRLSLLTLALLWLLPLTAGLVFSLHGTGSAAAWRDLLDDPRLPGALRVTLRSALVSTALALLLALVITAWLHGSRAWQRLSARLAGVLALPHAAFAVGLAWLVAPSGAIARLLAPLAGWSEPPPWGTVNDPGGWLLTAVLVLKELPFLLWSIAALLARPDVELTLQRQRGLARSLGYTPWALWWRLLWPLWIPRLAWPLSAVLAYSLTVVDLGLIVGPSTPPTWAVMAYGDLVDASPLRQDRGVCAALLLTALLAAIGGLAWLGWRLLQPLWLAWGSNGKRALAGSTDGAARWGGAVAAALLAVYGLVLLALLALSFAGVWRFPAWLPQRWTSDAWLAVAQGSGTVGFTIVLAAAASLSALVLSVAWFESAPPRWDAQAMPLVLAPLVVPGLLLMTGLYRGALSLRLDGTFAGLWWAHLLVALPYVFIALQPAWRGFDRRYEITALTLGRRRLAFWWRVKWRLLAPNVAAALAVGFAVSVAQFLATQFVGAGRHATVTTEAVTLASGGQRTLAAAFALLQALLPLLAFALAHRVARRLPR